MDIDTLEKYGIDTKKGIARCLDDEEFYEKMLSLFLKDTSFSRAEDAYAANDYDSLFKCAHELKGVCGNADIAILYSAVCPLVEHLRNNRDTEKIPELFEKVKVAYLTAKEGIIAAGIK